MKNVVIIGAGPAGLTAAYYLLKSEDFHPIIIEAGERVGGISRTDEYKGNRVDLGGHRFFSKKREVIELWQEILPPQGAPARDDIETGRECSFTGTADPEKSDNVLLKRRRVSRIYYRKRFFDYPITLKPSTFINTGLLNALKIGFGYMGSCIHKLPETSLESFYINRFGKPLYRMFFEDYTKKLWGVSPADISADWGAQRVKDLSVKRVIKEGLKKPAKKKEGEALLTDEFYYPKLGPGQLWERLSEIVREKGAELYTCKEVVKVNVGDGKIVSVTVRNSDKASPDFGKEETISCDYLLSSMPIKDLAEALPDVPEDIYNAAVRLPYRDFITVGLLLDKIELKNKTKLKTVNDIVPDCWIYVQERDVKVGRLQIFNNWSPYMVDDINRHIWVGMEYFCSEGDSLWNMKEEDFIAFAESELEKIGVAKRENIADSYMTRVKKAYPAYFGTYSEFPKIKEYLDTFPNLFCIGRNGQHRYNNMDHSMLTAKYAAEAIISGTDDKKSVWNVNTEQEYNG